MRRPAFTCAAFVAWLVLSPTAAEQVAAPARSLKCDVGPVTKVFGLNKWLAYSCDDGRSVVLVSAPDSSANPFYFTLSPAEGGYRLTGEGAGKKEATEAAAAELSKLSERDIAALIEQTKLQPKQ